jgi:hypothetical protein
MNYEIDNIFLFIFIFTILYTFRIVLRFFFNLIKTPPEKFLLSGGEQTLLGLSISYIITYLIN